MVPEEDKTMRKIVMDLVENSGFIKSQEEFNKFSKIVPSLLKKGIDNLNLSMFSPELKNNILVALGEGYRKKGNLHEAAKSFLLAENKAKLNSVGEDYERLLQYDNCIEIYKTSGNTKKLFEIGRRCLVEGKFKQAAKAFVEVNYQEGLKQVGDACIENCKFDQAFEVLSIIKDRSMLITLGDKCVEEKNYAYALNAYQTAESKEKLNQVGDLLLSDEHIHKAMEAYALAENEEMVSFIKDNFAE